MRTVALYSIKGGVGKTASAVNLGYLAARDGERTLLLDLDPQGSASFYLRLRAPRVGEAGRCARFVRDRKHSPGAEGAGRGKR